MARDLRTRVSRPDRTNFAEYVDRLPVAKKTLGLTHITSAYTLRDIIENGVIKSQDKCDVLEEEVIYAFYGRAAYRHKESFVPANLTSLYPTVFILDPHDIPPPKYVFGFDSGAFCAGVMDDHLHPYMPLFDFLLTPNTASAARLIEAVFSTPENFFQNRPGSTFTVPPGDFEAESYASLIKSGGHGNVRLDDRLSTPEIVFADPISLAKSVRAVILPETLGQQSDIGGKLRSLKIRVDEYPWTSCSRPGENHFMIQNMVTAIYKDLGWL
ncbi:hypothetical protein FPV16_20485 [Methylobacterium sp. W2]|uniref:hypothetical protein n=1 Tax=Methylobacterium sp. W2 TaxID=2598107 RepID=UPI001D0C7204|nr:hypothetical protein [Methylobacterium sp. W2]MCC0808554.1 hypothetical protein [Methylobacterium sp. W2]